MFHACKLFVTTWAQGSGVWSWPWTCPEGGRKSRSGSARPRARSRSPHPSPRRDIPHDAAKDWRRERDSNPRTLPGTAVFKTAAINRSAIPPLRWRTRPADCLKLTHVTHRPRAGSRITHGSMTSSPSMYGRSASGIDDRSVLLLVVLQDRDQRAAHGEARAVQRVHDTPPCRCRRGRNLMFARRAWNASVLLHDEISR